MNSFNDRPYAYISDVSKCFKKGGTFDITRARSVTLNKEEVQTFISMTDRLSTAMDRIAADSNSTDSDSDPLDSDDDRKSGKRKGKKAGAVTMKKRAAKKVHFISEGSDDSDKERTLPSKNKISSHKKQFRKKRMHPYSKPRADKKQKKAQTVSDSSDTDLLSD